LKYSFEPKLSMTIATILVIALCIKAGLWQYNKAETKKALQTQLNARLIESAISLNDNVADFNKNDSESLRFKRVKVSGTYDRRYQILLDNQVDNTVVGYHVITPMQIESTKEYVLVNRGWIAGNPNRTVPKIDTPESIQVIEGDIVLPSSKFFTLEDSASKEEKRKIEDSAIWQHMDMQLYAKSVPFAILPFILRLDSKSNAGGGFKRNWPLPAERVSMHLGYAYQWFGFALTLLVIFIVLNVKKVER
jgi:surfeit locus 1 family protein